MAKGYLALVLHAHLPFVRHPEYEEFLEENWLFEAITETYIPLLRVFNGLVRDGVKFQITMSLTPPLVSMLTDPLLQDRYARHISRLIELAEKEVDRTRGDAQFAPLAHMYRELFLDTKKIFDEDYGRNIVTGFRDLQNRGCLEIITCGATHGYLPLMAGQQESRFAQISVAVEHYRKHFGRGPRGISLPECAYDQGVEEILRDHDIQFFIIDSHGVEYAEPRPRYGVFAPLFCPNGVAAFARDVESSKQVWSAKEGYPGDFHYREFYRDVGYDLDFDYIKPYIHKDGIRINTGVKYYRITGASDRKEQYQAETARQRAADHAGNFLFNRGRQVEHLGSLMDRKPIIVAPYDAELFGHWWFEGPQWLDFLFRKMHFDQDTVKSITPMNYLEEYPVNQVAWPCPSSWGYKGYHEVWLEGSNHWIYRHLHVAADRMVGLANAFPRAEGLLRRALDQAARELLLAQSSDWAFIMKTGTTVDYAVKRTKDHISRFTRLCDEIRGGAIDEPWLAEIERRDNIFPDIDYSVYRSR